MVGGPLTPEKPEGWEWKPGERPQAKDTPYFAALYQKFANRRFWRRLVPPDWCLMTDRYWHQNKAEYEREKDFEAYPDAPSFEDLRELGYV